MIPELLIAAGVALFKIGTTVIVSELVKDPKIKKSIQDETKSLVDLAKKTHPR